MIKSPYYGWLGSLAFSGAAWRVEARDRWIGWSDGARKEHLSKVVCNSRFLIFPQVKVSNLAFHVLSLCVRRLPEDWLDCFRNDARSLLCCERLQSAVSSEPKKDVVAQDWAEEEFGQADLGDRRLTKRLVGIVQDFYARPQACQTRAKTKVAYRFFDHPNIITPVIIVHEG